MKMTGERSARCSQRCWDDRRSHEKELDELNWRWKERELESPATSGVWRGSRGNVGGSIAVRRKPAVRVDGPCYSRANWPTRTVVQAV